MNTDIRIVVLDLGGVMIRLSGSWEASCQLAGIPFHPYPSSTGERERLNDLEVLFNTGKITSDLYFQSVADIFSHIYNTKEIAAIYQTIICEEFPGIIGIVHGLRQAGIQTACLSNTCAPHWEDLTNPQRYPAICALDRQFASHLLGFAKPNEQIYHAFESLTGCSPTQILFFDDRQENIDAALACGWQAVHIVPESPSVTQILTALEQHGILLPLTPSISY